MNTRQFWTGVRDRAADNLAKVSGYPIPRDENDVRNIVHAAFKIGTYGEAAAVIIEADEWIVATMNLAYLDATGVA